MTRDETADLENLDDAAARNSFVLLADDGRGGSPVTYGPCARQAALRWLAAEEDLQREAALEGRAFAIVPLLPTPYWSPRDDD